MSGTTVLDSTSDGTSTSSVAGAPVDTSYWRGAVFTAGNTSPTYEITGVRLGLDAPSANTYSLTLSLYAVSGTTPSGSALASASFSVALTSTLSYTYLTSGTLGTLASASLTSGSAYALIVSATTSGARLALAATNSGTAYTTANGFSGSGLANTSNSGGIWGNLDFTPMLQLQTQATCFLRGTLILTARGEVPVERLKAGELVATKFGGLRPVRWIGTQHFEGRLAGRGHQPIRFAAGSLGQGVPSCDLFVSPGHAMLIPGGEGGDLLAHAGALVNGETITQERVRGVIEYFHIDLGPHDCVQANGAWAESYFEDRNRDVFHNAAEFHALHPGHEAVRQATCLPVVTAAYPWIDALRARLPRPMRRAA
jgi:hypothetical protein